MVERFHPTSDSVLLIAKHPNGDYVRYSDYASLRAEVERLTRERDRWKAAYHEANKDAFRIAGERDHAKALAKLREGAEPVDPYLNSEPGKAWNEACRLRPTTEQTDARSGVRVNALKWADRHEGAPRDGDLVANAALGQYVIRPRPSVAKFALWVAGATHNAGVLHDNLDAAKAAAQADYERRIRSALVEAPE